MRPIDELEAEICTLAGHINAATYRFLLLVAEYDRRTGWNDGATQSCAHWLNWKCGIAFGAAREKVRVARALEKLPKISAAMEVGRLSYSKVREITRVAEPHNEDYLLMIADNGTAAHVERLVRAYRRCQDAEEMSREARQQENRCVTFRYDDDGSLVLTCRLTAEAGARVMKALDVAVEDLFDLQNPMQNVPAGTSTVPARFAARRADALAMVAESFLAHGSIEAAGGDRQQIVVHVAAETLRNKKAGCCEFEHGPSMSAETARRLSCDASVVTMIENGDGEPLSVGRKTRTISTPLRLALNSRDKGCRFPGCANNRWLDAHHMKHWANVGETKPSNLVSLCRFHHRAVHEGGIRIEKLDDGALRFVRPNGVSVDRLAGWKQPPGDWRKLPSASEGIALYGGDPMDLGHAVDGMIQLAKRARVAGDVPAGTSQ